MANKIKDSNISKLGFGFMRLPRIGEEFDMEQINKMVDTFLENGGTYFDTAFVYQGSEEALRKSLVERYPREKFRIATKLNLRFIESPDQIEGQFKTSMERLGVEYIDFYMLHGLDAKTSQKAEEWGAWTFIQDLKAKGIVKHIGFSFHGPSTDLEEILTKHPEVDFCQLQINYLDWESPKVESRRIYEIAREHDVPVIVMEPVKGGMLAGEDAPIAELLRSVNPNSTLASWALRFCTQLEGVLTTLSGMSALEHVVDNVATYNNIQPLSPLETETLKKAVEIFESIPRVPCTSCNYCEICPSKIMIPAMLDAYNNYMVYNTTNNVEHAYRMISNWGAKASACVECGACEDICPQKLDIINPLKKLVELFE